ncbi:MULTISPECIES: non-ribosomal peptide synthetase [Nostocales]|uniref:Amino acid adenylation domain-containing protein n=3 Tax=Nostocales TaxID=1161 RepID=A0A0C1R2G6_9CYAN|nr:non-ribosomal peptide synthetase [Tolypothrix bouteillei]KAF3885893.1 amino acid adenylation domain-containing protein [Tolypothrix bouteillei VB521301]
MDKQYSNLSPTKKALLDKWKAGNFKTDAIPKCLHSNPVPLSFSQQRLWFIDQLYQGSPFYNIPSVLHLEGSLNVEALQQSLNEILRRHEAWRTIFIIVDEQPMQVVTSKLTWELPLINLEHLSNKDWEPIIQQLATEEAKKPFNLATEVLVRATLVRLRETEHVLLLTMHHIITDGWSMGVFARELATLYAAFSTGQSSPLSELPIQYRDFTVWQRHRLQGKLLQTQLNYWKQQLSGELPVLQLPVDRPRPTVATFIGAKQYFTFSQTLTAALNKLSQREEATLFMTLLAAFNILLYRYTDREDILVGSSIANRNRAELEGLVGLFVNTLVLRNDLSGNPSFRELLSRVREVTLNAYAHQDLPFEKLVEQLQPERDLSRNPLFQVMFVLHNTPMPVHEVPGLTLRALEVDSGTSQFDIFVSMSESQKGLTGFLEYSTHLFDATTINLFISHFQTLLESIVANPNQQISELPLLTVQEQEQLLVEWNNTRADYPRHVSLHQLFEEQVSCSPDALAFMSLSETITYDRLNYKANQLAHYLKNLGVTTGTLVAICLERSIEMVVALLAILKAGGAYLPLDINYPLERLSFMLSDSQVSLVISQKSFVNRFEQMTNDKEQISIICLDTDWETIKQESQENPKHTSTGENLAYVIYTSGSTGTPKGVLGTHKGTVNGLHWLWKTYPFMDAEVCCQKTAISFVDSVWEIFAPLLRGIPTVIIPDGVVKDPQLFLETLANHNITRVILVPSLLQIFLDTYGHLTKNLSHLRLWITSGEALSLSLAQTFRKLMPHAKLINLYGSSEVSANVTYYDTTLLPERSTSVPIGHPIDNTQAYVLNRYLQLVPKGAVGELYIGGDGLAKSYLNRAKLTQEKFIDNPFVLGTKLYKTGDLVRYLNNGELEYLGRYDDQVKIRGFRVELGEIAIAIAQHPDVREAVVIVRNDAQGDRHLIAYLVQKKENLASDLLPYLQQRLPKHMIPSSFVVLDAIPLTPNGKVDKQALPTDNAISLTSTQSFVAPRNFTELALAKIWENLLSISPIGVTNNFFDLGGHSFLAIRLIAQINERFGKNLALSALFENTTIEKLAKIINQETHVISSSPMVAIQPCGSNLPLFCVHAAGGEINNYLNLAKKLGIEQPFYALEQRPSQQDPEIISVEEIAAYYLNEIRAVQPHSPYLLGGWCYGGMIAFEMAQQLQKQGETVNLLVVIDTILPESAIQPTTDDDAKLLLRLAESVKNWFGIDFSISYDELVQWPLEKQFHLLMRKTNLDISNTEIEQHFRSYKLFKAHIQAMRNYVPQVYPQEITLLKAREEIVHDFQSLEFHTNDPLLGWGRYSTQPINMIEVPGNHFSMFNEPHVQELANQLKICLDKAKQKA